MLAKISAIIAASQRGERFTVTEVLLDEKTARLFIQLRHNPPRFIPQVFAGDWAVADCHAQAKAIRLLAVVVSDDGVVRLIGRQGSTLFCTWSKQPGAESKAQA